MLGLFCASDSVYLVCSCIQVAIYRRHHWSFLPNHMFLFMHHQSSFIVTVFLFDSSSHHHIITFNFIIIIIIIIIALLLDITCRDVKSLFGVNLINHACVEIPLNRSQSQWTSCFCLYRVKNCFRQIECNSFLLLTSSYLSRSNSNPLISFSWPSFILWSNHYNTWSK